MSDEPRIDSFDDLFEPFELEDGPPAGEQAPPPPPVPTEPEPIPTVDCPSCGTANPNYNRHCEACGARLTQQPLPMAAPPMVRATPGGRALGVLAAVVLIVAIGAFLFNTIRGDDTSAAAPEETSSTTSTTVAPVLEQLRPTSVVASSHLDRFEPENLIDSDPDNYWNDEGLRGQDATLTFRFAQPVQISEIELVNLQDEEKFKRNYRIKGYQVVVDDVAIELSGTLEDIQDPQRIQIASVATTELTIKVTSTYPAQAVEGLPPFNELALQEIRFYGTTS